MTRFLPMVVLLPLGVLGSLAWWAVQKPDDLRAHRPAVVLAPPPAAAGCVRMAGFTVQDAGAEFGDLGAPAPQAVRTRC